MAKVTGAALSLDASKQLGGGLIFQRGKRGVNVTTYHKPNNISNRNCAWKNRNYRFIYNICVSVWRNYSNAQREVFNELALSKGEGISGWNYFVKVAMAKPADYLGLVFWPYFGELVNNGVLNKADGKIGVITNTTPASPVTLGDSVSAVYGRYCTIGDVKNIIEWPRINIYTGYLEILSIVRDTDSIHSGYLFRSLATISKDQLYYGNGSSTNIEVGWRQDDNGTDQRLTIVTPTRLINKFYCTRVRLDAINGPHQVWLDKALLHSSSKTYPIASKTDPFRFGYNVSGSGQVSKINKMFIFNRLLRDEEINAFYNLFWQLK